MNETCVGYTFTIIQHAVIYYRAKEERITCSSKVRKVCSTQFLITECCTHRLHTLLATVLVSFLFRKNGSIYNAFFLYYSFRILATLLYILVSNIRKFSYNPVPHNVRRFQLAICNIMGRGTVIAI